MAVTICHASISEQGNAGWDGKSKAGDQTGKEVCTRSWYNKAWTCVCRYPDATIRAKAASIAKKLAKSNLVGYDQSQRNTLYKALKKYNFDVDAYIASKEKTETDCSAFMYACYCCVVPSMRSDSNAPATAGMKSAYEKFGFQILTASKYLTGDSYLVIGDVIVRAGHHTAMAVTNGSKASASTSTTTQTTATTSSTSAKSLILKGQQAAVKFTGISQINGKAFDLDGVRGAQTKKMAAMVLQTAINKDYGKKLEVDGEFGALSKAALGTHYVEVGEKQYMVTAAEIMLYMLGKDPKGIEYPGEFGSGLKAAAGKSKITENDFLSYLN